MRISYSVGVIFGVIYRYSGVAVVAVLGQSLKINALKVCISPFPALH